MCGIVGVIPKTSNGFWQIHQKMFEQLLYVDALRGQDATGVIGVMNNGDFGIAKEASPALYFQYSYDNGDLDKEVYSKGMACIGHNRYATVGDKADDNNAHPFVVDDTFAMVHNGSLRQHKKLANTVVDSEALAIVIKQAMDQDDWQEALETVLGKVDGAYACVWYDQKRNEVCMVRNSERPLALMKTEHGVIFGSEAAMLSWVALRNNSKIEETLVVPINTLIRFDLSKGGALFEQIPLALRALPTKGYTNGKDTVMVFPRKEPIVSGGKAIVTNIYTRSGNADVSKQAYKRFRDRLINKEILFEADDYIEKELFQKNPDKFILMGESKNGSFDICDFKHIIKTSIDLSTLNMTKSAMEKHVFWMGTVSSIDYSPHRKSMEIHLKDAMPVYPKIITNETSTSVN